MFINASLSRDGLEELYSPPTLKEICLYKFLTNKEILTKEVELDEDMDGSEKLYWAKFRLKEPMQRELVEAVLDAGEKYLFRVTPKYVPVLAAIRMSQPEHLVKVHVNNMTSLKDYQLEFLLSGDSVKSLDIDGCYSLRRGSLDAINKYGSKLKYLRIGESHRIFPEEAFEGNSAILRTPNLKTFVVSGMFTEANSWTRLLQDFISNLEDLQMIDCGSFDTLEFLEPAKNKLKALTWSHCHHVPRHVNEWDPLFKLNNLRSLDLIGSLFVRIGDALTAKNVVQRLLTSMPNLKRLAVGPGLVKDIYMDTPIRGQGSAAKRLEFLGIMDNDEVEIRKAKLLANEVAYLGTMEGEFRMLEYYSNRLNSDHFETDHLLEDLVKSLGVQTPPCRTVAVISLLIKIFKNKDGLLACADTLFETLKQLLTADVAAKLGDVLLEQCIEVMIAVMSRTGVTEPKMVSDIVDVMMYNLDGKLCFDHYMTMLPLLIRIVEDALGHSVVNNLGMEVLKGVLRKTAQILEKVVDQFPGEIDQLWGISLVLVVLKEFKKGMRIVSEEGDRIDFVEIFSNIIASLRKLCLNSGSHREGFYCEEGVKLAMDFLTAIIDGWLGLADRDGFDLFLLEILTSIVQDSKLDLLNSGTVAPRLEKLLLSAHSQWELWKSSNSDNAATYYFKMESIVNLLNYLESDPRVDYKSGGAVKEIMTKLK